MPPAKPLILLPPLMPLTVTPVTESLEQIATLQRRKRVLVGVGIGAAIVALGVGVFAATRSSR
jgi:hypothetical protein